MINLLMCRTCGVPNQDPGGDPAHFTCAHCHQPTLVRVPQPQVPLFDTSKQAVTGAAIGGTLGAVVGGPLGAAIGAVVGGAIGNRVGRPRSIQRARGR